MNVNALTRIALKHLTFLCRLKKNMKYVKEFKEIIRYLILLFFLGPFFLVYYCLLQPRVAVRRDELRR